MSSSAPTLETFLVGAKTNLQNTIKSKGRVTLVIGDDSADLDGIVASILFSYFHTANPPSSAWHEVYTPLVNASKNEIKNPVVERVLGDIGLQKSQLIAVEDLVHSGSTQSGLQADKTRFFLINHNKMAGRHDEDYSRNVLGCIDRHKDEEYVARSTDPEPRIIVEAGSTTSLVVNWANKEWDYLEGGESVSGEHFAKFALAPILIETKNLEGNSTEEDVQAVKFLERKLGYGRDSYSFDRAAYYDYLVGGGSSTSGSRTTGAATTSDTAIDNTAAFEKASALSSGTAVGTGYYDPYAKEETTGPAGFAYRFKGDSTTAGASNVDQTTTEASTADFSAGEPTTRDAITTGATTTGTATETKAEEAADEAESGAAAGGITGAATAVLNFFTGKGKSSHETEEETEPTDTTSGAVGTGTDVSAREATGYETGANTTGTTAGSTSAESTSTTAYPTTSQTNAGVTTNTGLAMSLTSRMPWLAEGEAITSSTPATSTTATPYTQIDLASILSEEYAQLETPAASAGLVGISYTSLSLAQLIAQAEKDLVNRAIAEAESSSNGQGVVTGTPASATGTGTASETEEVLKGTPFTAAVRRFAKSKNIALYAVATAASGATNTSSTSSSSGAHRELFLWQFALDLGAFIPRFEAASQKELGLTRLSEQEEIVKEPGMPDGMMRAYSQSGEVSRDEVAKAITRSLTI